MTRLTFCATLIATAFSGCAHNGTEKAVDQKIATEPTPKSGAALQNAEGLTTEQKNKLFDLRDSTRTQINDYTQQSLQLRSILMNDLLANKSNAKEIEAVKGRLRKVEEEKLNVLMGAVDKARGIMGKKFSSNRHVINGMFNE